MATPAQATITGKDCDTGEEITCKTMFNPSSLKVALSNQAQDNAEVSKGSAAIQITRSTTSKLETELIFDTTDTGDDVRTETSKLKKLAMASSGKPSKPSSVEFRWGRFLYKGVIESLNETLDFWAAEGIPLRATITLVIQGLKGNADQTASDGPEKATLNPVQKNGTGTTGAATAAGDPRAGRAIAAANGIENMRMAAGGAVAVSAGVTLKAAAAFSAGASAGAGFGASAGAGFGASASAGAGAGFGIGASAGAGASAGFGAGAGAGFGASASAGFGAGASAGFGASASAGFGASASAGFGASASAGFGASASSVFGTSTSSVFSTSSSTTFRTSTSSSYRTSSSAGVSASAGAFAGLGVSKTLTTSYRLDPARLLPPSPVARVGSATQFDFTGRAISGGSSGLSANVSAGAGVQFGWR